MSENLSALIRFHESGGHAGKGDDETLALAEQELTRLATLQARGDRLAKALAAVFAAPEVTGKLSWIDATAEALTEWRKL